MDRNPIFEPQLVSLVHKGMTVYDVTGEKLGEVEGVKMSDPGAVTAQSPGSDDSFVDRFVDSLFGGEPELPAPIQRRLLRTGYIKVDGPGLADTDRYVRADAIAAVDDDSVRLSIRRDQIPTET